MTNKHLSLLGVVALVMVLLTVAVTWERSGTNDVFLRGSYLVQGLDPQRIGAIHLERQDDSLYLERSNGRFVLPDKGGYPVVSERVNHIFMAAMGIRVDEMVTANPDNHAILGVDGGEMSTTVRFLDREGRPLAGIVLGDRRRDEQTIRTYVRLEKDSRVYLSEQIVPFVSTDFGGYIRESLFEGDRGRFVKLELSNHAGTVGILRQNDGFAVEGVPEETPIRERGIEELFHDALDIRIVDILPLAEAGDIEFGARLILSRDDEIHFPVAIGSRDGRCYVKAEATADFGGREIVIYQDESDESLREKEALLLAAEAVETFNDRHRGWVYQVDDGYLSFLEKAPVDLLR